MFSDIVWCYHMCLVLKFLTIKCVDWMVLPQNSYGEALIPNMTIFGDKTLQEVVKVQVGHKGKTLIQ